MHVQSLNQHIPGGRGNELIMMFIEYVGMTSLFE